MEFEKLRAEEAAAAAAREEAEAKAAAELEFEKQQQAAVVKDASEELAVAPLTTGGSLTMGLSSTDASPPTLPADAVHEPFSLSIAAAAQAAAAAKAASVPSGDSSRSTSEGDIASAAGGGPDVHKETKQTKTEDSDSLSPEALSSLTAASQTNSKLGTCM